MPIKAVLFDMFDTIMMIRKHHDFNSPSLTRMYKLLSVKGIDVSFEIFREAYVKAREEVYAKADENLEEPHFKVRISETLKILGYDYDVSTPLVEEASAEFCKEFMNFVYPDENAEMVLRGLFGKYKLAIVSNFAIPECVHELLRTHGLDSLFDVVVVSAAVNKRKPSPEIFKSTLEALGVSADETIFVGDTLDSDIEGAKTIGIKAIYIERRTEGKIGIIVPDKKIKSLNELESALKEFQDI
jgi:putative hydrolase of the HAD superfamily